MVFRVYRRIPRERAAKQKQRSAKIRLRTIFSENGGDVEWYFLSKPSERRHGNRCNVIIVYNVVEWRWYTHEHAIEKRGTNIESVRRSARRALARSSATRYRIQYTVMSYQYCPRDDDIVHAQSSRYYVRPRTLILSYRVVMPFLHACKSFPSYRRKKNYIKIRIQRRRMRKRRDTARRFLDEMEKLVKPHGRTIIITRYFYDHYCCQTLLRDIYRTRTRLRDR